MLFYHTSGVLPPILVLLLARGGLPVGDSVKLERALTFGCDFELVFTLLCPTAVRTLVLTLRIFLASLLHGTASLPKTSFPQNT